MRYFNKIYTIPTCLIMVLALQLPAAPALADDELVIAVNQWQYNRLFNPSPRAKQQEQQGHIVIYDGLKDVTVNRALDEQFERIKNMMFTGIVITDDDGKALEDPDTGELMTEDDGC